MVHLRVVHGAGRETDGPPVGKFRGEGETGAASRAVAHDGDVLQLLHGVDKVVGGAVGASVCQHTDGLLPAHAARWLQVDRIRFGEVAVPRTGLVADVAGQYLLVGKAGGNAVGVGQLAAGVVAYVDDEPFADGELLQHVAQVAVAHGIAEALVVDVADVVVERLVLQSRGDVVVLAEVDALNAVAEVLRVVLVPVPVTCHIEARVEIDVSVAQFGKHPVEHIEQVLVRHVVDDVAAVTFVHFVPVKPVLLCLVVQEAVLLVDGVPQCLEVAPWAVVVRFGVDAREQSESQQIE